jgi:hypothetical protein
MNALFSEIKRVILNGEEYDKTKLENAKIAIKNNYFETPIEKMMVENNDFASVIKSVINVIKKLKA